MNLKASGEKVRGVYQKVAGSKDWWIRFADSTGRIRREKAGTKSAAKQLYAIRKAGALQKEKLPHSLRTRSVTFADLAKLTLAYSKIHKRSYVDDVVNMKLLVELFGNMPVESLTPQTIQRKLLAEAEERKWKPATVNRHRALLSLTFRLGVEQGRVDKNPIKLIRPLPMDNHVIRYLTDAEERSLRSVIEPLSVGRWATIQFSLHTGIRAGEQFKLGWADVHRDTKQPYITLPKTKNGAIRHVPLNRAAMQALETMEGTSTQLAPTDTVFGCYLPYRAWFESALQNAKIERFRWHDLRHTFASRLAMADVNLRTISELMGHKSLQMVLRYAHLAPTVTFDAVERLVPKATDTKTDTSKNGVALMSVVDVMEVAVLSASS